MVSKKRDGGEKLLSRRIRQDMTGQAFAAVTCSDNNKTAALCVQLTLHAEKLAAAGSWQKHVYERHVAAP